MPLLKLAYGMPGVGGPMITSAGLVFIGAATDDYLCAIDKRVPRLLRTISKDTLKKMSKLLDAKQMEAFEYALDLENRRFMQSNGVHEP